MSEINNPYGRILDQVKAKLIDPQIGRIADAQKIMDDPNYPWKDAEQKNTGAARLESLKAWKLFYDQVYKDGRDLVYRHENLLNLLCAWYVKWYNDVSNEGIQETEMMKIQADMLNEIFSEMYKQIQDLGVPEVKMPKGLNLK